MKESKRRWLRTIKRARVRTAGTRTGHPFYSSTAWRKFRKRYMEDLYMEQLRDKAFEPWQNGLIMKFAPVCEVCFKQFKYKVIGEPAPGRELHHKKDINPANAYKSEGYGEPLSRDNVQLLCRHHHFSESMKHSKSKGTRAGVGKSLVVNIIQTRVPV